MSFPDPGIKIRVDNIHPDVARWFIKKKIAQVLHLRIGFSINDRPGNFSLEGVDDNNPNSDSRSAFLIIPNRAIGQRFLQEVFTKPIIVFKVPLQFTASENAPRPKEVSKLYRSYYVNADMEKEYSKVIDKLLDLGPLQVSDIQFGVFFHNPDMAYQRSYSVEWSRKFEEQAARLTVDYDRRRFVVQALLESACLYITIPFSSLLEIDIGISPKNKDPYICFDTRAAPSLAQEPFRVKSRKVKPDNTSHNAKQRIAYIDDDHERVAPYAPFLRLRLHERESALQTFKQMCEAAKMDQSFLKENPSIPAYQKTQFFSRTNIERLQAQLSSLDWHVAFQLEALIRSNLLSPDEIHLLIPLIRNLSEKKSSMYIGDLLRTYHDSLKHTNATRHSGSLEAGEYPPGPLDVFERSCRDFVHAELQGVFRCCHVIVTPTRLILEGPYVTQTNRVITKYKDFWDHFIRVEFRDEDLGRYRSDRDVEGFPLLQSRVGGLLNKGFSLAGRSFEFLGYSSSSIREHAVWYLNPFKNSSHDSKMVFAGDVRASFGRFEGQRLRKTPSEYAAKIGQLFESTSEGLELLNDQWEEMEEDLECGIYNFTGAGTISESLARKIWQESCEGKSDPQATPSAYKIRLLGYEGVVSVDLALKKTPLQLRLRPSMKRFNVEHTNSSHLEVVQAFRRPKMVHLNRALIMVLEDRKVPVNAFLDLQKKTFEDIRGISQSISNLKDLVASYQLGTNFQLLEILCCFQSDYGQRAQNKILQLPLFQRICRTAASVILREIRDHARIPVEGSYHLVGVVDEGPEYVQRHGWKNVVCLQEREIFACIDNYDGKGPIWLQGPATISRHPITHTGDIQRVHAIGKPPSNQRCLFAHLRNVVVMRSQGNRPPASCLSGGDLGGGQFSIIMEKSLIPEKDAEPADYSPGTPFTLKGRETVTTRHIAQFIVQFIESDVVGFLSDKLLLVADQSPDGVFDKKCQQLAELYSKAADYLNHGVPVQMNFRTLPMPLTPDWYGKDIDVAAYSTSNTTFICESPRALGHLFREAVKEEHNRNTVVPENVPHQTSDEASFRFPLHPITSIIQPKIANILGDGMKSSSNDEALIRLLFDHYRAELQYICSIISQSRLSKHTLSEEEIILGFILWDEGPKQIRKDRQKSMRDSIASLVRNARENILEGSVLTGRGESHADIYHGLELSWCAWNLSVSRETELGANSFGLIALETIFYCLHRLG